jgi:lipid-A-disaccharide synthase
VTRLLVVAGEGSGDRLAGATLRALGDVDAVGLGGAECRAAGLRAVADASATAAMGVADVIARAPAIARAAASLLATLTRDRPRAALLVDYTELNVHLGRLLRARGVRVLWCVAPQVWAWRAGRLATLGRSVDRLAVVLPFEEPLWRAAGVDARYVGHPALEARPLPRDAARAALGLPAGARAVGLLPGSRAGEVARLAPVLVEAARRARDAGHVDVAIAVAAPSLDDRSRALLDRAARRGGVRVASLAPEHGAAATLRAFDALVCASGTATLEAALAGVPTVLAHRLDALAWMVARRLVRVPHVALPSVVLGERAMVERLQGDATPETLAEDLRALLAPEATTRAARLAERLRAALATSDARPFGARVAALLDDWLATP